MDTKRNCIFTICAKNYIGLAQILESSIQESNPGLDYFIVVADELTEVPDAAVAANVLEGRKILSDFIENELWEEMAYKYNLTEFCTSIKAFCFDYFFKLGYEKVIFLDPDIYVFSSFESTFHSLDIYKIILTPHITTFSKHFQGARSEKGILSTGIFNLGFIALQKSQETSDLLIWWSERLKYQCYIDVLDNYFTDQKWMDFLPALFGHDVLHISDHLGLNVAPWNFFEREIYKVSGIWHVKIRSDKQQLSTYLQKSAHYPLVFVHYSGYDYKALLKGEILQKNVPNLKDYSDVKDICNFYIKHLKANAAVFNAFIMYNYTYDFFSNGVAINTFHRRLFRSLLVEKEVFIAPFDASSEFYKKLKTKKMFFKDGDINIDNINKLNMPDTSSRLRKINWIMNVIFNFIGLKQYTLLLRLMRPYSRVENHIHLLDPKYSDKLY